MCNSTNTNTNFAGTRDAANHVIRFDIRQGKLAQWMGLGQQRREYDYVHGRLTGISLRKHELPGGEMTYIRGDALRRVGPRLRQRRRRAHLQARERPEPQVHGPH